MLAGEYKKQLIEKSNIMESELMLEIMNTNEEDLTDIVVCENDITKAIDKLNENSGPGPDEIPAIFLVKTNQVISIPLMII